ncbi:MAG: hypothetical protein IPL59_17265 [Candidatus Competibacteraceae bacterium]|nr:hypothetical protein [Candidatus Competibacteraceae bacterium]
MPESEALRRLQGRLQHPGGQWDWRHHRGRAGDVGPEGKNCPLPSNLVITLGETLQRLVELTAFLLRQGNHRA